MPALVQPPDKNTPEAFANASGPMSHSAHDSMNGSRHVAAVVGWLTVLAFVGLSTTASGFFVDFRPPFTRIGPGEATLWLGSAFLLCPASCLLGYAHHSRIYGGLSWVRAQLHSMSVKERALGLGCLTLLAIASARLCNALVLHGLPVTDDEWATRFGGEILAAGHISVPIPFDKAALPTLYTFIREGKITSLDWLGSQLPWALSSLSGTGNWVFALLAALPIPCLGLLLARRLGASWAVGGIALFVFAPMSFALSMSSHGHVSSRAFVALTLVLFLFAQERSSRVLSMALGLALGIAMTCRPFETCSLLAPLFLSETWRIVRHGERGMRLRWALTVLGVLLPVALFFAHTLALTGSFMPARHHPLAVGGMPTFEHSYWVRFGSNCAFNALRLAVWFAGPIGIAWLAAGVLTDRFTRLLGIGILSALSIGLLHDNYGIHIIGPIHYSECAVPLTIICLHGLANMTRRLRELGLKQDWAPAIAAVWLLLGLGSFDLVQSVALHDQAKAQSTVYDYIEETIKTEQRPAILFVPRFAEVWMSSPELARRGSWVFEWRRPSADFSDEILILHGSSPHAVASARRTYPDRQTFQLNRPGPQSQFAISPLP